MDELRLAKQMTKEDYEDEEPRYHGSNQKEEVEASWSCFVSKISEVFLLDRVW